MRDAVDAQLRRIGSDIESFLKSGIEQGRSPRTLVTDLEDLTAIKVSYRSVYRWIEDLKVAS